MLVSTRSSKVGLVFSFSFLFTQLHFTSLQYERARVTHRHHDQSQLRQLARLLAHDENRKFEEKLSEARAAKKSKSPDTVPAGAGSGSADVDEEFEDCMLVAVGSPITFGRQ